MRTYVVGLCYTPVAGRVVLIRKNHPAWMQDKLNGVGGEVNPGEDPRAAMDREWDEETTLPFDFPPRTLDWERMLSFGTDGEWRCHVFRVFSQFAHLFGSRTEERVGIFSLEDVATDRVVDHLDWLVPYCANRNVLGSATMHVSVSAVPRAAGCQPIVGVAPAARPGWGFALLSCIGGCGRPYVVHVDKDRFVAETQHGVGRSKAICPCGSVSPLSWSAAFMSDAWVKERRGIVGVGKTEEGR